MAVSALALLERLGHEELILLHDPGCGLRGVIAIHDTTLGPAAGGTRMRPYASLEEAVVDALRLSHAMTCKAAMAGVPWGGGKAVLVGDPARDKTPELLGAYARAVARLDGRFQTGADMGIDANDLTVMSRSARFVGHTPAGAGVNAADLTALGILAAVRTVARALGSELRGLRVAVQGLGQIGSRVARLLREQGAVLTVADLDPRRVEQARAELQAEAVPVEGIYDVETDVFSPNAAGPVFDERTVPRLRCRAVVGAANEQLAEPEHGELLYQRGILYAPDYVVNAGGLLSLLLESGRTDEPGVRRRVEGIGDTLAEVLERARREGLPPHRAADLIVQERLAQARRPAPAEERP